MASLCPLPLDCSETYGRLAVHGWSLHTPAWCAFDLSALYASPEVRGENVTVEGQPGRVPRRGIVDETTYSLPMLFSGAVDRHGEPHADPAAGLLTNRAALTAHVIEPVQTTAAGLTATLDVPGVGPRAFIVQPLRLEWEFLPGGYARGVLTLRVPVPDRLAG